MSAAPQLGNSVWEASKYCMDQMGQILSKANKSNQPMTAKISCQLDITEYGSEYFIFAFCPQLFPALSVVHDNERKHYNLLPKMEVMY